MRKAGFTLIEILIVVIVLGVLAAIVAPQFTSASETARELTLRSDVLMVRNQLEHYRVQHGDQYPWEIAGENSEHVIAQMTNHTNDGGQIIDGDSSVVFHKNGPYMDRFPVNPFVRDAHMPGGAITFASGKPTGTGSTGWYIDTDTGKFYANTDVSKYPDHIQF